MLRWSRAGVLDQVFEHLPRQRLMQGRIEAVCLMQASSSRILTALARPKNGPKRSDAAAAAER